MHKPAGVLTAMLLRAVALAVLLAAAPPPSLASPGHDHGGEAPAAAGEAAPRTETHSELFEFVGVLQEVEGGHALLVTLDRYATNEPVEAAALEVEVAGQAAAAEPQPDGTYLLRAPWLDRPGRHDLTVSVTAGEDADLLAASLTLPDEAPVAAPAATDPHARLQQALGERRGPLTAALGFVLGAATVVLFQSRGRWRVAAGSVAGSA